MSKSKECTYLVLNDCPCCDGKSIQLRDKADNVIAYKNVTSQEMVEFGILLLEKSGVVPS